MDPDANLAEQRRILARYRGDEGENEFDLNRLATLVEALDEWITKGGFLPAAWRK